MHHLQSKSFTNTHTPKHFINPIFDYPQNLVVIDSQVEDYQRLITGVVPHSIIVVLTSQQDSIEQLTEAIRKYHYCTTLHLVSHGYPGGITVGNSQLNLETLNQYSSSLQQWNLNTILLYGCQVAAGDAGTEFIEKLYNLTGSNIAASTTKTGHYKLDGNWNLDVKTGQFDVTLAFNQATQTQWNSVLNDTLPDQPFFFQVIDGTLKLLNPLTGDYVDIGSQQDVYNATGLNTNDNFIYGLGREGTITDKVIRIKADGSIEDLEITVPTNATNNTLEKIYAGDVDNNNNLWLRQGNNLVTVKVTDNTISPTTITFTDNTGTEDAKNVADLIWVNSGGQGSLYGVHNGELYVWNIDDETITSNPINDSSLDASLKLPNGVYGAAWIDTNENLYVSHNTGKLYRIDNFKTSPTAAYITETAITTKNDGMSNPTQKSPFIVPFIDLDGSSGDQLDVFNYETTFTEDSGGINIVSSNNTDETQDIIIRDFDQDETNQLISAVTITLTNKEDSDQLIVGTLPSSITASTSETDREITVTLKAAAGASPEDIELALEAITFNNTSDTPDETARTIEIFLTDPDGNNGNITTTTVNIVPVNDPPSFTSLDNTPSYTLNGSAIILDTDATISDVELDGNDNYNGATLTLARNGGANAEDVFNNSSGTLNENGELTVNGTVIGTVTTNNNGTLVITFNNNATADLVDQALQEITYSNTGNTTGSVTIDYIINDENTGQQGTGGSLIGSDSITVNLTNNNNPIANSNNITVDEESENTSLGLTSPTDIDGDTLTITITEIPILGIVTKADGTIINNGDILTPAELTELIYDAPADYNGTDDPGDFSYQVTDGNGGSDTGIVDITINTVNNNPIAENDNIGTTKNTAITIDVLADNGNGEDSDPDNDELTITQINGTNINPGDTITLDSGALLTFNNDGTFSYDPNDQFDSLTGTTTDTDSFTYTIFDGTDISEATVTITIAGENSPPIAVDDTDSTDANTILTGNVLTDNGNGEDSDPDGNDITVNQINDETVNIGQPIILESGAEITLNPDGTFSYNPNGQFTSLGVGETATETFTYTVNDGIADSTDATVTITINGVNDDPIATEDNLQTSPQRPLTFDPLTNDTDPDGDDLTLESINTPPNNGEIVQNPDGTLTYIRDPNFTGVDSFTYIVNDGNGGTSTATVTIDINPDNDGDGILDADDLDDDNDGIPDSEEGNGDTDGDGVPDIFDLDSDNDGISDLNESGLSPEKIAELDTNGDGVIDTPVGDNGLADDVETTPDSGELDLNGDGIADKPVDTDGDNIPDFQDLDSDNDGILDVTEVGNPDTDGNGIVDGEDSDGNGLIDTVDPNNGNSLTTPPDSDSDGVPDYVDLDSDSDGIHDIIEGGLDDTDGDGIVGGSDSDGDGIANSIDNNDGFGNIDQPSPLDSDRDNIPDYLDLDSDADGINDIEEVGLADPDGDGRLDSNDVDGDGIADAVDQNNDGFGDIQRLDLPDSDGDGIPDFRDVNNPPIATDDNTNVVANTPVTIAAIDNDSDPDNDILSIDSFDSTSTNGGNIIVDGNNF
ncbi:MAG: Ig-like domain-containing protein, partial [Microcoleaceae cyanobacterium]